MENVRECRICMTESNDEESLIQPCRCNTAYVHESCLQKWRSENTDNEKYRKCEICQADYVILQDHPKETFEIYAKKIKGCPLFCMYTMYLFIGALATALIDTFSDQTSLVILNGGNSNITLGIDIDDINSLSWFIYYLSYASYIYCMIFFVYIFFGLVSSVHRKQFYIKKTRCTFSTYFIMSWTYFYNFYIFYKVLNRLDLYMAASLATVPINFCIMKRVAQIHDSTIRELNTNNVETIISVRYNPLIEITTIEDEAEN